MLLRKAGTALMKVARSPITSKVVSGLRKTAEVADILEVPFAGKVAKGLEIAGQILSKV